MQVNFRRRLSPVLLAGLAVTVAVRAGASAADRLCIGPEQGAWLDGTAELSRLAALALAGASLWALAEGRAVSVVASPGLLASSRIALVSSSAAIAAVGAAWMEPTAFLADLLHVGALGVLGGSLLQMGWPTRTTVLVFLVIAWLAPMFSDLPMFGTCGTGPSPGDSLASSWAYVGAAAAACWGVVLYGAGARRR